MGTEYSLILSGLSPAAEVARRAVGDPRVPLIPYEHLLTADLRNTRGFSLPVAPVVDAYFEVVGDGDPQSYNIVTTRPASAPSRPGEKGGPMSHAVVTVCVAPDRAEPVQDAIVRALAPFDQAHDPDGRWDRWRIDGQSATPGLPVRAGYEHDPRVLRVSPSAASWPPSRCDGAPRALLDFELDRVALRRRAEAEWAEWWAIAAHHPQAREARAFLDRYHADPVGYPLEAARHDHAAQPVMRAYEAAHGLTPGEAIWEGPTDPIYLFGYDQVDYLRRCVARAIPTPELLTLDGTWSDYADFSTDRYDTAAHDRYYLAADAYLDRLPPKTYVVRLLVHS